jgi:hypothetical protein
VLYFEISKASEHALKIVREKASGIVHSVFDNALNIAMGEDLVGVVSAHSVLNPISMRSTVSSLKACGIRPGMAVVVRDEKIAIGGLAEADLSRAVVWKPRTKFEPFRIDRLCEGYRALCECLKGRSGEGGFWPLYRAYFKGERVGGTANADEVVKRAKKIIDGLVWKTLQGIVSIEPEVSEMLGLGIGLTPSGDDFLCGYACALAWVSNSSGYRIPQLEKIASVVRSRQSTTTVLSFQLLQRAIKGEASEAVEGLLESVFSGKTHEIKKRVSEVFRLGETSGADMMLGLALGLRVGIGLLQQRLGSV